MQRYGRFNRPGLRGSANYSLLGWVDPAAQCKAKLAPDMPSGATATAVSSTGIDLAWNTDPTAPPNEATSYVIERSNVSSSGPWTQIASVDPTPKSYQDRGLVASTKYWYQIKAVNCAGESAYTTYEISATTNAATVSVQYLVVAGGGGPGSAASADYGGGGGGGGGFRTGTLTLTPGVSQTITVGGGGSQGSSGSNSVFSTITSTGGGRGGNAYNGAGASGGSGGGGASTSASGVFPAGGAGTSGQGNAGGNGFERLSSTTIASGGGGGAGAAAANATSGTGSAGGAGSASSISGASVTYAGGGGGGTYSGTRGTGGSGGGGTGGLWTSTTLVAVSGTANTGGGGGAGNTTYQASGGSGVVILRYPNTFTATFSAGVTQTQTTSGSDKINTITAAGVSDTVTFN